MSSDGEPPSPRVEAFITRLATDPPQPPPPPTPRTVGWLLKRVLVLAIGAALVYGVAMIAFVYLIATACACTPKPGLQSPVDGVVIAVESAGLGKVSAFSLRLVDGSTMRLTLGTLENATEFSPSHLAEHQATSVPVRAFFRRENGVPIVYRLEDALP